MVKTIFSKKFGDNLLRAGPVLEWLLRAGHEGNWLLRAGPILERLNCHGSRIGQRRRKPHLPLY